jgi:predicted 3-demethylubiquinone-9 3-methyltransferase (glyoxalase superfamily)
MFSKEVFLKEITPCLWFDGNAEEAVNFYVSLFNNSKIANVSRYGDAGAAVSGQPKGSIMTMIFRLEGQPFMALNGGPEFKFSPAISFFVNCKTEKEIDGLWKKLSEGATVLMELGKYPFSEKFGWLQDKFGISWQLMINDRSQRIVPFLTFVGDQFGKAEDAINLYTSLFPNSGTERVERYEKGEQDKEGAIKHAVFRLNGQDFMAMESSRSHQFTFTHAISFMVMCENQAEVDHFWNKLSKDGQEEPCGWLQDKFGVSWQIIPLVLPELLQDPDRKKAEKVMKAMLQMKKIDINALKQAYES